MTSNRFVTRLEGQGDNIKRMILNIDDISKVLNRNPLMIMSYLSACTGACSQMIGGNKYAYLVGEYPDEYLDKYLEEFIDEFVYCRECEMYESELQRTTKGGITLTCLVCQNERLCEVMLPLKRKYDKLWRFSYE